MIRSTATVLGSALLVVALATPAHALPKQLTEADSAHTEQGYNKDALYVRVDGADINAFNFNYVAQFPISVGLSYPENAGVSLSLNLTYNSSIWRYQWTKCQHVNFFRIRRENPFGLGFDLHLGRIVLQSNSKCGSARVPEAESTWAYVSPDGAHHSLWYAATISEGEDWRSHDGSHLRAIRLNGNQGWRLYMPDGEVQEFEHEVAGPPKPDLRPIANPPCCVTVQSQEDPPPGGDYCPDSSAGKVIIEDPDPVQEPTRYAEWAALHDRDYVGWHLTRVHSLRASAADPTSYSVEYFTDPAFSHIIRRIQDQFGRYVEFTIDTVGATRGLVRKIDAPAPADAAGSSRRAVYDLSYSSQVLTVASGHQTVWRLDSLTGPVLEGGVRYIHRFSYWDSSPSNPPSALDNFGGQLRKVVYPSGKAVVLSYQKYQYKTYQTWGCNVGTPPYHEQPNWGVSRVDTYFDGDETHFGNNHLAKVFSQSIVLRGMQDWADVCTSNDREEWYDQIHTMLDSAGNSTEFRYETPDDANEEPEYGLLESEKYFGGNDLVKKVEHEYDLQDMGCKDFDMVEVKTTTTYADDRNADGTALTAPTQLIEERSNFDHFGHAQQVDYSGNAIGTTKSVITDYANDDTDGSGVPCAYADAMTLVGLGDVIRHEETREVAAPVFRTDYAFEPVTGRQRAVVQRASTAGAVPTCVSDPVPSTGDVVTTSDFTPMGDISHQARFIQGSGGPVGTTFASDYGWDHGVRAWIKETALPYFTFARTIDADSGLVREERSTPSTLTDTAHAVVARIEYDVLGRRTKLTVGNYLPVEWTYESSTNPQTQDPNFNRVRTSQGSGDLLTQSVDNFEGGRLVREDKLVPGAVWAYRYPSYDAAGRVTFLTNWTRSASASGVPGTDTDFTRLDGLGISYQDPFGRPAKVTDPIGNFVETSYFGTNKTVTQHNIAGIAANGSQLDIDVTSHYFTDGLGRLRMVRPGFASASTVGTPGTTPRQEARYSYDILGRMTLAELADSFSFTHTAPATNRYLSSSSGINQTRTFDYDAIGRLTASGTPEAGVVTTSEWNALGDPVQVQDALGLQRSHAHRTTYDAAGRPTRVERVLTAGSSLNWVNAAGASGWTLSGGWVLNSAGVCIGQPSWYIGVVNSADPNFCQYARTSGGQTAATLISPQIPTLPPGAVLSFKMFREVRQEGTGGSRDRLSVKVAPDGGGTIDWDSPSSQAVEVLNLDSTDISWSRWQRSPAIDLQRFAGQTIKIRFLFNSVDQNTTATVRGIGISEVAIRRPQSTILAETTYDEEFGITENRPRGRPTTITAYDESTLAPVFSRQVQYQDAAGLVSAETLNFDWDRDGVTQTANASYAYDSRGELTNQTVPHLLGPSGSTYQYTYRQGLLTGIQAQTAGKYVIPDNGALNPGIEYDDAGGVALVRFGNDLQHHVSKNDALLPTRIWVDGGGTSNPVFDTGTYQYDGAGNIKAIGPTDQFRYDAENRLTWARVASTTAPAYGTIDLDQVYDEFGNMTSQKTSQNGGTPTPLGPLGLHFTNRTYFNNRILTSGFLYDSNGNLTQEPSHDSVGNFAYSFSPENRLALIRSATGAGSGVGRILQESLYDVDSKRWAKITKAGALVTLRTADGQLSVDLLESNATSGLLPQKEYIHAGSQLVAVASTCGPRPALALATPATQGSNVCFVRTDYVPPVGASTVYIEADDGQFKTLSSNYGINFCIPQSTLYPNQTNRIQTETDAACGHTGYSNAVSYSYTTTPSAAPQNCLTSIGGSRSGFTGGGSSNLQLGASGPCSAGTTFNAYFQAAGGGQTVKMNGTQPLGAPIVIVPNLPCGAGLGDYWMTSVSGGTESAIGPRMVVGDSSCGGGPGGSTQPGFNVQWYHWDHLGSTRLVTDEQGVEIARFKYYPFGMEAESTSADEVRARFTGHERDDGVGLDYMMARYYGPNLSRFASVDSGDPSLELPRSWNAYSYAYNNPVNVADPDGEEAIAAAAGFGIGAIVGLAIEGVHQYASGKFDGQKLLAAAAGGGVTGGLIGLTNGASLLVEGGLLGDAAIGAGAGVAGGVTERALDGDASTKALSTKDMALDAAFGAASNAGGKAVGEAVERKVAESAGQKVETRIANSKVRASSARSSSRQAAAKAAAQKVAQRPKQAGEAAREAVSSAADAAKPKSDDNKDKQ